VTRLVNSGQAHVTCLEPYQGTEQQWHDLLSSCAADTLFITPGWQKVWWEQFGDGAEKLLLCLKGENSIEAIAPLARRNGTISFIGSQDVCDYNDFLVSRGAEARFYPCLLGHLDGEEWETLELSSLPESSPTLAYLPDLARQRGYSVELKEEDVAPALSLPDSWDAYLGTLSKKDRHELRRKLRRLGQIGGGEWAEEVTPLSPPETPHGVRCYKLSDPAEVESSLEDFFALMRSSRETKHRFLTPPREQFFRNIAREMSGIGVFKLFFLELKGERVAAAMCFDYGPGRLLYNSGFNPAHGYYSVGLLLKALCIKDAIEEGKAYFDFLRGSEPYKYDLGGKNRTVYQMVVKRS